MICTTYSTRVFLDVPLNRLSAKAPKELPLRSYPYPRYNKPQLVLYEGYVYVGREIDGCGEIFWWQHSFWGFSPKIGQKSVILGIFLQKVHLDSGELETLHTYTLGEVVENLIPFIHESAP